MARVLILSSFVAASPVGGGAQVLALAGLGIEAVLIPTVLFGRHPGLGAPGGGPLADDIFESMLAGVEASGAFGAVGAVICGYFAGAGQAAATARTIDAVRAASPGVLIVVDPIMGDDGRGLYVGEAVAEAIAAELVPRADLIAPNAWEMERLTGARDAQAAAARLGKAVLVSSVDLEGKIGVVYADGKEAWAAVHRRIADAPNGCGDLLTALFTARLLIGDTPGPALKAAVTKVARTLGVTSVRLRRLA